MYKGLMVIPILREMACVGGLEDYGDGLNGKQI